MTAKLTDAAADPVVAYRDEDFLDSDDARPLRILAEYLAPLRALREQEVRDTIVFFGSARILPEGPLGRYYTEARELAHAITTWSMTLEGHAHHRIVCSGGGPGIMEAANRGATEAGGRTIGLNIGLPHEQRPNPYITPGLSFEFHYFFMRKLWFAHTACALVAFPEGSARWTRCSRSSRCSRRPSWIARSSCCSTGRTTGARSSTSMRCVRHRHW